MAREHLIDTTELEPPEPFQRIMALIPELETGDYIRMRHRRLPHPLFASLAEMDFAHRVATADGPPYEILIWRRDDTEATAACGPADAPPADVPPGQCP